MCLYDALEVLERLRSTHFLQNFEIPALFETRGKNSWQFQSPVKNCTDLNRSIIIFPLNPNKNIFVTYYRDTTWWGWNLIEKKSPRIAECRFGYLRAFFAKRANDFCALQHHYYLIFEIWKKSWNEECCIDSTKSQCNASDECVALRLCTVNATLHCWQIHWKINHFSITKWISRIKL